MLALKSLDALSNSLVAAANVRLSLGSEEPHFAGLYARSECAEIVMNLVASRALARNCWRSVVVLDSCWRHWRYKRCGGLDGKGRVKTGNLSLKKRSPDGGSVDFIARRAISQALRDAMKRTNHNTDSN